MVSLPRVTPGTRIFADDVNVLADAIEDTSPLAEGDVVVGGVGGAPTRLPIGPVGGRIRRKHGESQPSWDQPDAFNIADFYQAADGSDYSPAASRALAAMPAAGGALVSPAGLFDFLSPVVVSKTVVIQGAGAGLSSSRATEWRFAAGINGLVLTGSAIKSVVTHLALISLSAKVGAGSGIVCRASRSLVSDVYAEGWGDHGAFFDTAARTVTAATEAGSVATITVAGHGFVVGENAVLTGFTPAAYNGVKVITAVTTDTFTFVIAGGTGNASVLGTCYAGNANGARVEGVRAFGNGGDGIRIEGADSNICALINCDGSGNDGYGIANRASKTGVYSPHASGNTTGDYYDRGSSAIWLNPYAESSGKFVIDTAGSSNGYLLSVGVYAPPTVWSGNPPVLGAVTAVNANWTVIDGNVHQRKIRLKDPAGSVVWSIFSGSSAVDVFSIHNSVAAKHILQLNAAGDRITLGEGVNLDVGATTGTKIGINATRKLALWGAATDVQPPANPDTSGATLTQLEIEVNELKALLRRIGAMAP